ncbi:TetR/AcrR family transcriptional regulator [Enterococcus gallinarum]|uniref:TetR/AcrR family transcriptional regulator n=1 Tax=Enterococcus gallinarum TaxID=1353 RepID=UPI0015595755|nr:TetR/AcrR family transcriptional regulator [Enterococcus gallinarum]NQE03946.1 TetR/AcrR family transcriptional regulator [Enterococcus gallinarum]
MFSNGSEIFNRLNSEKQQFILKQIIKEFGESGYDRVSMRNIAKNTGVSIGSLYQYFNDKEGILKVAIEQVFNILSPYIDEIEIAPLNLESRLEVMFSAIYKVSIKHPEIISFYNKIPSDKRITKEWSKQFHNNKSFFKAYWNTIDKLQKEKEISSNLDPIVYAFIVDTLILSGEIFHNIQYQKIKSNVFVDDLSKSNLLLKENIIDSLIELAGKDKAIHED